MSGHPIEPIYGPEDVAGDVEEKVGAPGRVPVHPRPLPLDVPGQALDDAPVRRLRHGRGDQRALPLPARPRPDRALDRLRHADPDGLRLRPRPQPRRGRPRGGRRRQPRRHGAALRGHPAGRGHHLDDDQRAGGDPARLLRAGRRGAGRAAGEARRHDPDRHPQGVHRPEGVVLPDRAGDAPGHRHDRVVLAEHAALAPGLDLRLPHPRGGLDRPAGARLHAQGRLHLRRAGARARPRRRRLRPAALLLLQRPHRLLRGDRQVPGGAPDLGPRDEGDLRRQARGVDAAALPRADRRRLADRPAAAQQRRPHLARGAGGGARRHPVAAHQLLRRGARPAHRGGGAGGAAHPADHRLRVRRAEHARPARRLLVRREADRRDGGRRLRLLRPHRRAGRHGRGDPLATSPSARSPTPPSPTSASSTSAGGSSSASTTSPRRTKRRRRSCASTRPWNASRSTACRRPAPAATAARSRRPWPS